MAARKKDKYRVWQDPKWDGGQGHQKEAEVASLYDGPWGKKVLGKIVQSYMWWNVKTHSCAWLSKKIMSIWNIVVPILKDNEN